MIILEGPDGSGKTTLAKHLCELFDLQYVRPPAAVLSSSNGPQTERGLIEWWLEELKRSAIRSYRRQVVYDRTTFISDPIYRLAMGGRPQGTPDEMGQGVYVLSGRYDLCIFCLPPFEKTLEAVHAEGRDKLPLPDEMLYNVWWAYHYFYELWKQFAFEETILYNWENRDRIIQRVKEALSRYGPD